MSSRSRRALMRSFSCLMAVMAVLQFRPARGEPTDIFNIAAPAISSEPPKARDLRSGDLSAASQTGAAQYHFTVQVPPGRGVRPDVGLSYSSHAALFGDLAAGWQLTGLATITEFTERGRLQTHSPLKEVGQGTQADDDDRFTSSLAGGRPLVPVTEPTASGVAATYRAKHADSGFLRYQRMESSASFRWRVFAPDGTTMYFGDADKIGDCQHVSDGYAPITRRVDQWGNEIAYTYRKYVDDECVIDKITWGQNSNANLQAFAEVQFQWKPGSTCSGVHVGSKLDWRSGVPIVTGASELEKIKVYAYPPGSPSTPVHTRIITMLYDPTSTACDSSHSAIRLLTSIQESAWGTDAPRVDLPPVTFDYGPLTIDLSSHNDYSQLQIPWSMYGSNANLAWGKRRLPGTETWPTVEAMFLDIDGDGKPDRVESTLGTENGVTSCGVVWRKNLSGPNGLVFGGINPLSWGQTTNFRMPMLRWQGSVTGLAGSPQYDPTHPHYEGCALNGQVTAYHNSHPNGTECHDGTPCTDDTYCPDGNVCGPHNGNDPRSYLAYRWLDMDGDGLVDLVAAVHGSPDVYDIIRGNDIDPVTSLRVDYEPPLFGTVPIPGGFPSCSGVDLPDLCKRLGTDCTLRNRNCVAGQPCTYDWSALDVCLEQADDMDCELDVGESTVPFTAPGKPGDTPTTPSQHETTRYPYQMCGNRYPWFIFKNRGNGNFDDTPTIKYQPIPLESDAGDSALYGPLLATQNHGVLDLDGDQLLDGIALGRDADASENEDAHWWTVWPNDGTGQLGPRRYMWFGRSYGQHHISSSFNPSFVTAGSAMGLFDINGDGLPDHWVANPTPSTTANLAYNTGTGFHVVGAWNQVPVGTLETNVVKPGSDSQGFDITTDAPNQVQIGSRYSPLRVLDLDADGRVDVVTTTQASLNIDKVSWNQGGQFSPLLTWDWQAHGSVFGAPNLMGVDNTTIGADYAWHVLGDQMDLDGDGIAEAIYWSGQMRRDARAASDPPPRLLRSIDNHRGAATTITYASMQDTSAVLQAPDEFWWDGRPKSTPATQWVVKSYETIDTFASTTSTTSLQYEHPRHGADDEGRYGFRGFAKVTTTSPTNAKTEEYYGYAVDWSGRLEKTLVRPAEALGEVRSIEKTTWESRTLFGGAVKSYHATVVERLVCANGQDEAACTPTAAPGYTRTTSTLAPQAPLGGGPDLLWQETETLLQGGMSDADGDRKTISTLALVADGSTYRLRPLTTTRQHRVGGTFTTFAKSENTWDATYREKLTEAVWVDADDSHRAITRFSYDANTGNVLERFKPVQNASSGPGETYQYDARGLFVALETNELGHVRELEYEYGTGSKLTTKGPNEATCPINCPPGQTCLLKEQHTIRIDGIGREIEQWDTVSDDGCTYFYHQRATTSYVDTVTPTVPASTTHKVRLDVETSVWTEEKTEVDGRGRPIKTTVFAQGTAPADQITTFTYSNSGRLVAVEVPDPSANTAARVAYTYTYDSLNRPLSIRRPDATQSPDKSGIDIVYDGLTKTTSEESGIAGGNEAVTKTITDRFGRLIQVHEQLSDNPATWAITSYSHGPDDLVTSVVDPENVTTALVHDFAGRRTEITRHGRTWKYGYDKNGNMISQQVPGSPNPPITDINYTTTIAYDHLDRPVSKVVGQRELSAADQALFGGSTETFWYDLNGNMKGHFRLWQSFAPGNSVPIVERSVRVDNQGSWWHARHGFNLAGYNLVRDFYQDHYLFGGTRKTYYYDELLLGGNSTFSFTNYDARGLPSNMWAYTGVGPIEYNIGVQTRNVAGLVTNRRSTPVGGPMSFVESSWTYDKLGRVTNQVVQKSPSPSEVVSQELGYLGNDDPSSLTHSLGTSSKQFNFTFDKRHQLTNVTTTTPGYYDASYQFGTAGRFMRAAEAQTPTPDGSEVMPRDVSYVYGGADPEQVTALVNVGAGSNFASFTYDLAGNQTTRCLGPVSSPSCTGELLEYTYDGKDQLRRVTKKQNGVTEGSEEYWYDYDGSRIAIVKRDNLGNKTELITFTKDTEAHYDSVGAIQYIYSHLSMGTPVARIKRTGNTSTETEYQFHGLASSTIAAVASDGTINASFSYAPFGSIVEATNAGGNATGTAAHRRRFNEKYTDELSALSYYGARYYDKALIGWTQSDPLYRFAPDAGRTSPRRALLYTFSNNNPLRYIDPDGRNPLIIPSGIANEVSGITDQTSADLAAEISEIHYQTSFEVNTLINNYGQSPHGMLTPGSKDDSIDSGYGPLEKIPGIGKAISIANDMHDAAYGDGESSEDLSFEDAEIPDVPVRTAASHRKNKRESNREKHERGDSRRKRDKGGEKGDNSRRPPRKKPPNHKGPWPPPASPSSSSSSQQSPDGVKANGCGLECIQAF